MIYLIGHTQIVQTDKWKIYMKKKEEQSVNSLVRQTSKYITITGNQKN